MLDRRLLLVTGKGGTGKSAVTAALAIRAAREGKQVLAMAMTDPAGLAAHLGETSLTYRPHQVQHGLYAMAIERAQAVDEYIHLQLHVPRVAPLRPLARSLGVFVDTVPGIREVVMIGKVLYDVASEDWDLVVADAPPTGQVMSYLRAPGAIAGLVPAGRVREQAGGMAAMLANRSTTGVLVVTIPEELPVSETEETLELLEVERLANLVGVVANRVLPDAPAIDQEAAVPAGPHRDALTLHRGLVAAQAPWLDRLPEGPRLPYLFGLHTPGEVAARLADLLEAA